jgi:hypothetical protein
MRAGSRVVAVIALAVAAACSSGGGDDESESATSTTSPFGECLPRSSTVARTTPAAETTAFLLDARVTRLDACADEIVFEFGAAGGELPPGYEIGYEPGPTFVDFTSQEEFDMTGGAFLVIRFLDTVTAEFVEVDGEIEGRSTFDLGRESIAPSDMNHLVEARIVQSPTEGVTQWVIALDSERPFTIDASAFPPPLPDATLAPPPEATTTTAAEEDPASTTTTTRPPPEATSQIVVRIG